MNTRSILLLTALVLLAFFSWYLGRDTIDLQLDDANTPRVTSGYYLLDANITATDSNGLLSYKISAEQATQSALGKPIELQVVQVDYGRDGTASWRIKADQATLLEGNQQLELTGSVEAVWAGDGQSSSMRLTTDNLAFDAAQQIVETDAMVRFDVGLGQLVATGMRASLENDTVQLRSNIRGQFNP